MILNRTVMYLMDQVVKDHPEYNQLADNLTLKAKKYQLPEKKKSAEFTAKQEGIGELKLVITKKDATVKIAGILKGKYSLPYSDKPVEIKEVLK